jgi:cellulose synthase/poly-beta-1,6-N-acetylglucosamine synthase-like glycosyltransferase
MTRMASRKPRPPRVHQPRVNNARQGLAAILLLVLAAGLLVLAWWEVRTGPNRKQVAAFLPLNLEVSRAGVEVLVAALLIGLAAVVGIAALDTAASLRILNRQSAVPDRVPARKPRGIRRMRGSRRTRAHLIALSPPLARAIGVHHVPESPSLLLPEDPQPGTRLHCTVLVPAHNEEAVIGATLASLAGQDRPPDRVVVIADNCTDATVTVARAAGADVVETVGNTEKKAGALNQVLAEIVPDAGAHEVVLVMDADSTINPEFLATALGLLEDEPDLMAVGGLFYGEPGGGLIGQLQRNEYGRYQRIVARKLNRVFVLTGTASVIRSYALRAVAESRGDLVPGPRGKVYDTLAMTEDNELTLALKTLGARLTSPPQCHVTTEVMTTWRDLWRQRLRWHRGALENIGVYGFTRATALYWAQQLGLAYGVLALWSYFLLMTITLLAADEIRWSPFWITMGLVFVVERVVTVWAVGWRARALAAPIFPELVYSAFLQIIFMTSIIEIIMGRKAGWNYVPRPAENAVGALVAVPMITSLGILLPASILTTDWYAALTTWVALNTMVFVVLSVLQILPPMRRWFRTG